MHHREFRASALSVAYAETLGLNEREELNGNDVRKKVYVHTGMYSNRKQGFSHEFH